tara:strand:+ start:2727 stop:3167 length:441 start_codon:yes stop_codon:yes gene_type:complete
MINIKQRKKIKENIMENKIIRDCVQGLIDDSKMIDELCEQLETERINLVKVITDLDSKPANIDITWFNEKMIEIGTTLRSATDAIQSARSNADEAKYEASYADDNCMEGEQYISDARDIFKDLQSALEKASSIEDATQNEETITSN